jgi:hypothetical protein
VHLASALKSLEEPEDRRHGVLHSLVRIEFKAVLSRPEVSNGHAKSKLASTRFRERPLDESTTNESQLELAHRSLQAEKQAIVGQARVIRAIGVDDARTNHAAQLKQVVPFPAVASEPRCLEAENGPDDPLAKLGDERIKAGPGHEPARGTSKVLVDRDDVTEAVGAGEIGELVLTTLAL